MARIVLAAAPRPWLWCSSGTAVFGPRIVSSADAELSPPEVVDLGLPRPSARTRSRLPTCPASSGADAAPADRPFSGGTLAIDLTPAEGGSCVSLTFVLEMTDGRMTDCVDAQRRRAQPITVTELDGRATQDPAITGEARQQGMTSLVGWTTIPDATRAIVTFEDGTEREVDQFLRVTAPIDAAFFTTEISDELTHYPRRAVELVVLDAGGDEIARQEIANADPDEWSFPSSHDRRNSGFPPAADGSRAVLVRFPGTSATVLLAPAKGGVTCLSFRDRPGPSYRGQRLCLRRPEDRALITLDRDAFFWPGPGAGPEHPVILYGLVEPPVRRLELTLRGRHPHDRRPEARLRGHEIPPTPARPGGPASSARACSTRTVGSSARSRSTRRRVTSTPRRPRRPGPGPPVCP